MALSIHNPRVRNIAMALAVAALLLVLIVVLAWGKDTDARHRPLDFAESFDYAAGSFADYLAWSERRLRAAHPDASDEIIANLAPFRLPPAADCPASGGAGFLNGVVLTHDLLDSPYMMRALAQYFQSRCFLVYGLQLPGHGTRPGDLLDTDWQDWVLAEQFAARELATEVENLYLAGHGVGGTLAIREAAGNAEVDGLLLVAPALDTRPGSWRAPAAALFGWLVPPARWSEIVPAYSVYRYDSNTYRMTNQINALVRDLEAALPERPFEVPVFTVLSMEDATVSAQAVLDYMAAREHPMSAMVVYSSKVLPAQPNTGLVITRIPEASLLSLSHRALVVPIEDPEFGWYGASRDCGHYYRGEPSAYARCMAGERTVNGEITADNLAEGLLERVESNPFYYDLVRSIDGFFAPVARIPDIRPR